MQRRSTDLTPMFKVLEVGGPEDTFLALVTVPAFGHWFITLIVSCIACVQFVVEKCCTFPKRCSVPEINRTIVLESWRLWGEVQTSGFVGSDFWFCWYEAGRLFCIGIVQHVDHAIIGCSKTVRQ